jgi:hypothetical protein
MTSLLPEDVARLTPQAFVGDLSTIGWQDLKKDDPAVAQLREHLGENAGIPSIELVDPAVPGYAARAAFLLERDGFVVVKDVLDERRLSTIRRGAEMAIREMVGRDELRVGNRGSHRYSFGAAPASFGFQDYWSVLIDPPALMEVMEAIFGTKDFVTNSGSGGGDYNVPGSVEYQPLHSDSGGLPQSQYHDTKLEYLPQGQEFGPWPDGNRRRVALDAPEDPANTYEVVNGRDVPAREHTVTVNYPFEVCAGSTIGHTAFNGATRQIPGTASHDVRNGNPLPSLEEEPVWMKMSTTQPCPAGSAMSKNTSRSLSQPCMICALTNCSVISVRDDRAWHGGTPCCNIV